jgi:hypothetical protein
MMDSEEQFDLAPQIDEPMNSFIIVHLHNKSEVYHLTRQVLLDSVLTQNTYCFFNHILAKKEDEFNKMYGSYACLFARSHIEADLYLNVHSDALKYIIEYIQTGKLNGKTIYKNNWMIIDEIIDLATIFGMPVLVSMMRDLHPTENNINDMLSIIKQIGIIILQFYKYYVDETYNIDNNYHFLSEYIDSNKQEIIDNYVKPMMYGNIINNKFLGLIIYLFISPLIQNYQEKKFFYESPFDYQDNFQEKTDNENEHPDFNFLFETERLYQLLNSNKKINTNFSNLDDVFKNML